MTPTLTGAVALMAGALTVAEPMAQISRDYVRLVLAMGAHDKDYVDAYYGPDDVKTEAEGAKLTLDAIGKGVDRSQRHDSKAAPAGRDELSQLRHQYLEKQLSAMSARVRMLKGERLSFDEESKALYDAVAPTYRGRALPADARSPRQAVSRQRPAGRALRRVAARVRDPAREARCGVQGGDRRLPRADAEARDAAGRRAFTVEYVTNKSWSGYNWYQGNFRSLIQVNTDLPIYIDRAIDLACHEGYPGHHVYNALLEQHLVQGARLDRVHRLSAVLAAVADRRRHGELRDRGRVSRARARRRSSATTLFPARRARSGAGRGILRGAGAGRPAVVRGQRGGAAVPQRQDRRAPRPTAWLERYALMPHDRAAQRVRFFDQYRSYVINYNYGKDLVRRFIESRGGTAGQSGEAMAGIREAAVVAAAAVRAAVSWTPTRSAVRWPRSPAWPATSTPTRRAAPARRSAPTPSPTTSTCRRGRSTTIRRCRRVADDCCGGEFPALDRDRPLAVHATAGSNAHPIGEAIMIAPFFARRARADAVDQPLA